MDANAKEILTILQEECAEVIVEVSKCFRFGPDQIMQGQDFSNIQRLEKELGDVVAMIELLKNINLGVSDDGITQAKYKKFDKLKSWSNIKI